MTKAGLQHNNISCYNQGGFGWIWYSVRVFELCNYRYRGYLIYFMDVF